jgi:hypothetical protein
VRGHDAVLRARRAHADHFLGAEICRDEGQTGDPDWHGPAGCKEIVTGGYLTLDEPADAEHESEVQRQDEVVDWGQAQSGQVYHIGAWCLTFRSSRSKGGLGKPRNAKFPDLCVAAGRNQVLAVGAELDALDPEMAVDPLPAADAKVVVN